MKFEILYLEDGKDNRVVDGYKVYSEGADYCIPNNEDTFVKGIEDIYRVPKSIISCIRPYKLIN